MSLGHCGCDNAAVMCFLMIRILAVVNMRTNLCFLVVSRVSRLGNPSALHGWTLSVAVCACSFGERIRAKQRR